MNKKPVTLEQFQTDMAAYMAKWKKKYEPKDFDPNAKYAFDAWFDCFVRAVEDGVLDSEPD